MGSEVLKARKIYFLFMNYTLSSSFPMSGWMEQPIALRFSDWMLL